MQMAPALAQTLTNSTQNYCPLVSKEKKPEQDLMCAFLVSGLEYLLLDSQVTKAYVPRENLYLKKLCTVKHTLGLNVPRLH